MQRSLGDEGVERLTPQCHIERTQTPEHTQSEPSQPSVLSPAAQGRSLTLPATLCNSLSHQQQQQQSTTIAAQSGMDRSHGLKSFTRSELVKSRAKAQVLSPECSVCSCLVLASGLGGGVDTSHVQFGVGAEAQLVDCGGIVVHLQCACAFKELELLYTEVVPIGVAVMCALQSVCVKRQFKGSTVIVHELANGCIILI